MFARSLASSGSRIRLVLLAAALGACESSTAPSTDPTAPVVASVTVTPPRHTFSGTGESLQLTAMARDASGNVVAGAVVTWSSSAATVASVSSSGLVTAVMAGAVEVRAAVGAIVGTAEIDVGTRVLPTGGTVVSADEAATIEIPAGALGSDRHMTLQPTGTAPPSDVLVEGTTYALGPDGVVLNQAAELSLAYETANIPEGVAESSLRLYKVVDGTWEPVAGSTVDRDAKTVTGMVLTAGVYGVLGSRTTFSGGILEVTAESLDFTHVLGATECTDGVQKIGTVIVKNTTDKPIQWAAADLGGIERIVTQPSGGTLQPGDDRSVEVFFKCGSRNTFETTLRISATTGAQGEQGHVDLEITGTVSGGPAMDDDIGRIVGNMPFKGDSLANVLFNDAPGARLVTVHATTLAGGDVYFDENGDYEYIPPTGFTGKDEFDYTIELNGELYEGTVFLEVVGMVWFVDANATEDGDGSQLLPRIGLESLIDFLEGSPDHTIVPSLIYGLEALPPYVFPDGFKLYDGWGIMGQDGGPLPPGIPIPYPSPGQALPEPAPDNDVETRVEGLLELGRDNWIFGVTLEGIIGNDFGDAVLDDIEMDMRTFDLPFQIKLLHGTVDADFGELSGADEGEPGAMIHIEGVGGSVEVQGPVVIERDGIRIANSSGSFSFNDVSIAGGLGDGIHVENVSGPVTIDGLQVTTTTGAALWVGGASSFSLLGDGNRVTSTTGIPVTMANSALGPDGVRFESINVSGAEHGLVLDNLTGSFILTGDPATQAAGSGGVMVTTGDGVVLTGATDVELNLAAVQSTEGDGIRSDATPVVADNLQIRGLEIDAASVGVRLQGTSRGQTIIEDNQIHSGQEAVTWSLGSEHNQFEVWASLRGNLLEPGAQAGRAIEFLLNDGGPGLCADVAGNEGTGAIDIEMTGRASTPPRTPLASPQAVDDANPGLSFTGPPAMVFGSSCADPAPGYEPSNSVPVLGILGHDFGQDRSRMVFRSLDDFEVQGEPVLLQPGEEHYTAFHLSDGRIGTGAFTPEGARIGVHDVQSGELLEVLVEDGSRIFATRNACNETYCIFGFLAGGERYLYHLASGQGEFIDVGSEPSLIGDFVLSRGGFPSQWATTPIAGGDRLPVSGLGDLTVFEFDFCTDGVGAVMTLQDDTGFSILYMDTHLAGNGQLTFSNTSEIPFAGDAFGAACLGRRDGSSLPDVAALHRGPSGRTTVEVSVDGGEPVEIDRGLGFVPAGLVRIVRSF